MVCKEIYLHDVVQLVVYHSFNRITMVIDSQGHCQDLSSSTTEQYTHVYIYHLWHWRKAYTPTDTFHYSFYLSGFLNGSSQITLLNRTLLI